MLETLPIEKLPPDRSPTRELATLGLSRGDRVRFRTRAARRWVYGEARGIERDGSLQVLTDLSGGTRCVPVRTVQAERRGPRGGRSWTAVRTEAGS